VEWPRGQCCGGRAIHCPLGERTGSPRTGIVLSPPPGTGLGLRDCSRSNFCPINRLRVESNNWFQPDADLICRRPARVCHANYAVQLPGWAVSTTRICDASYVKCLSEPRSVVMHEDTYPRIEVNYASTAPKRCEFDDEQARVWEEAAAAHVRCTGGNRIGAFGGRRPDRRRQPQ